MGLPGCGIPESELPPCWSDDVRMNALFAPFRIKTANPESWDMKMKFWSDMLRQWCRSRKDPIVSAADAKAAFCRRGRTPACMDIVIEEMFRNGDLSPLSKYHQILHNGPEGWVKWGARLAFRPAAFALTAVASFMPSRQTLDNDGLPKASIDSTQRFVLESAVKEQATELLQNFPSDCERIGTIEELMSRCEWNRGREGFELLLGYLVSQGMACKKGDVVKLAEPDKKATPVTESDEALAKLVCAESRLEAAAARLLRERAAARHDARAALALGNRLAAKNHLRRKHKTDQRLEKCTNALDNVRQLLQQMRDVHVNVAIVDTYRTSADAMKRNMTENGIDEDAVHDTMDDLKEVMEQYSEVEKALGTNIDDLDTAELEDELRDLLAEAGGAGAGSPGPAQKAATKLPSPPSSRPSRKLSERDFVFDGEERMLAELNELGIEDASPRGKERRERVALAEGEPEPSVDKPRSPKLASPKPTVPMKPSQAWYPAARESLRAGVWDNNNDADLSFELRQDERLHPGQQLNVDFTSPGRLYGADFQVRDHTLSGGVWLYNTRDTDLNQNCGLPSTDHVSTESPGKSTVPGQFQMAPGGERRKSTQELSNQKPEASVEELEQRLNNLRGFKL
ncbi:charged multivesicular body protein 7 isoform X2 [Trichoplusia ni]|uniref:Charged multivesicular body protein 7 isoform X2 n=1 Tax=Trichoplusia ni TaxID=7111 RepID=A0A7E5VB26_TRINI|nr:charged multivesicular body protein 7 isoform X2 [Trichoplusia ni]XP_026725487.1 charged multivesicular body protein 7 isoform X2 [Trichoplusia ni]XP_026725488.1 charged multivesicular body protein 7 isoform X2 [Trichoplusia ni]